MCCIKPDAYLVNGRRMTPEQLKEEWEVSVEWKLTTETFDTWKRRLASEGKITAVFDF